ncbi:MAG: hypothetical protein HON90_12430, partial [Halobacteriovoraceae bacterium]|nr:hypothetical protein [Halobacteriovoraceae bacterium]
MKLIIILPIVFMCLTAQAENTVRFESTPFTYMQKVPYQQCLGSKYGGKRALKEIMRKTWDEFMLHVQKLNTSEFFPLGMGDEDMKKSKEMLKKMESFLDRANTYTGYKEIGRDSEIDMSEVLPDAYTIQVGYKGKTPKAGVGAGVGVTFALVIMPYCIQEYDKQTEEVTDSFADVETSLVGWLGGSVGVGVGGGSKIRVGIGAIHTLYKDFTRPDEFNGVYGGLSCSWQKVAGLSVKSGAVKKLNTMNLPDFLFTTFS